MWTFARQEESKIKDALVLRYLQICFFFSSTQIEFPRLEFCRKCQHISTSGTIFMEFSAQDKINSNKTKASFQFWTTQNKQLKGIALVLVHFSQFSWHFVDMIINRWWKQSLVSTLICVYTCVDSLSTSRTSLAGDSDSLFDFPSPVNNLLSKLTKVIYYYLHLKASCGFLWFTDSQKNDARFTFVWLC